MFTRDGYVVVSVCFPRGFVAAGGSIGIKPGGAADCALVATASGRAVNAAGVFTSNLVAAAPVTTSRAHLVATSGRAAAVLLTSGNANAATGEDGDRAAVGLCRSVAGIFGLSTEEVLLCQTGLIGVPFPYDEVIGGLSSVVDGRSGDRNSAANAAVAIMTTDTVAKEVVVQGEGFRVGGMAKGAAMLSPDMATMLAVLTTDAQCDSRELSKILANAVGPSFNAMTVDGCTSTNDTVVILASGKAGPIASNALADAVDEACRSLAAQMADDAEGATKTARVTVAGALSISDAHRAARKVADSLLVKCSLNGADPYWGRVLSELGSAGITIDPGATSIAYGGIVVCERGTGVVHDALAVSSHMAGRHIEIHCDVGVGSGRGTVLTTDLGHGYIDENRTTS